MAPAVREVAEARPALALGTDVHTDQPTRLSLEAACLGMVIIGIPGCGKTELLKSTTLAFMRHGDGVLFVDPHGDAYYELLSMIPIERHDDVIVLDPLSTNFSLNPLACTDPSQAEARAANFLAALGSLEEFEEVFKQAPMMKNILHHLSLSYALHRDQPITTMPRFLTDRDFRRSFYPTLKPAYPHIIEFWERLTGRKDYDQIISSSLNKLERFGIARSMRSIFGHTTSSINFRLAMDERRLIFVPLNSNRFGADNSAFLGAMIVHEVLQAALSRVDTPPDNRRQFHVVCDEFQTVMSTAFPDLIEQCRKFAVDVHVGFQTRAQLRSARLRAATLAVANRVIFTVTPDDALELSGLLDCTPPTPLVSGERPIRVPTLAPIKHLVTNSHVDERTREFVRQTLLPLYQAALVLPDRLISSHDMGAVQRYRDDERDHANLADGLNLLDAYFVERMRGQGHTSRPDLLVDVFFDLAKHIRCGKLAEFFRGYKGPGSSLEFVFIRQPTDPTLEEILLERVAGHVDENSRERCVARIQREIRSARQFLTTLAAAGDALQERPIMVNSGDYEPIFDHARPTSDVARERAQQLSRLPMHHAICVLRQDGQVVEHLIRTIKLEGEPTSDPEILIARSRAIHGRPTTDDAPDLESERWQIAPPLVEEITHLSIEAAKARIDNNGKHGDFYQTGQTAVASIGDDEDDDFWQR